MWLVIIQLPDFLGESTENRLVKSSNPLFKQCLNIVLQNLNVLFNVFHSYLLFLWEKQQHLHAASPQRLP